MDFDNAVRSAVQSVAPDGSVKIIALTYDPAHFGNMVAIMRTRDMLIRVVRDRSDIRCDIGLAACPDEWWPLEDVLAITDVSGYACSSEFIDAVSSSVKTVSSNQSCIALAFSPSHVSKTRKLLQTRAHGRIERMFPSLKS